MLQGVSEATKVSIIHAGMQKLVSACPVLASREEFRRINNLHSIDCISTRLWFDRRVSTQFPANVLGKGFEDATGGTFFNLNDLQVCSLPLLCTTKTVLLSISAHCSLPPGVRHFLHFVRSQHDLSRVDKVASVCNHDLASVLTVPFRSAWRRGERGS